MGIGLGLEQATYILNAQWERSCGMPAQQIVYILYTYEDTGTTLPRRVGL